MGATIRTAWLFPGQGSQAVGMGRDLLASFAPARELLALASDLAQADLARIIRQGPDALLARTDYLQPALTVINLGCCMMLQEAGMQAHAVAGHSLGEFSALYAAGALDAHDVLRLVVARGQLMHQISSLLDGGMMAVKGAPERRTRSARRTKNELANSEDNELKGSSGKVADISQKRLAQRRSEQAPKLGHGARVIESIVRDFSRGVTLGIANYNSPIQTVVSGDRAGLAEIRAHLGAAGSECVLLNVSGPWHSDLLEPAADQFAELLKRAKFTRADIPIVLNVTGKAEMDPVALQSIMQLQLRRPVRWLQSQLTMHALGIERFIEVGPGKTLRGLLRGVAELSDCEVVNVDGPKSLHFLEQP